MKIDELENRLDSLRLAPPSADFLEDGLAILRRQQKTPSLVSGWRIAFASVLLFSLSMNVLQHKRSADIVDSGDGFASNDGPVLEHAIPEPTVLELADGQSAPSGVFGFLCLTRSSLVLNESFYLGDVQGFGEWVSLQIPDAYQLSLSFQALRDWQPIGSYEDGVITVEVNPGQLLSFHSVGMGPEDSRPAGPLPIYGEIAALQAELPLVPTLLNADSKPTDSNESTRLTQLAALRSPYPLLTDVVLGVDQSLSPREQLAFGKFINDNECG